ncbi:hypothetical protein A0256_15835 [Mucilaginibacter sp. PAMC 26640]|nr:hypothetical protein A0256_15835 [Mucilaginibacter sp. PAMC 26640]
MPIGYPASGFGEATGTFIKTDIMHAHGLIVFTCGEYGHTGRADTLGDGVTGGKLLFNWRFAVCKPPITST